jgi:3-oxoacyl-[acyl-carrier protein] reductase
MKLSELKIGQGSIYEFEITQGMIDKFVEITGDVNKVHFGKEAIVHGMLTASFISTFIGMILPGGGAVWVSHNIRFIKPVYVNDKLIIDGRVAGINYNSHQVELYIDIVRKGELVVSSTCFVKVLE